MKTETIESTINEINSLETQLASVRSQLKDLGNDLLKQSTSKKCSEFPSDTFDKEKKYHYKDAERNHNTPGAMAAGELSLSDWRNRAEAFERRSTDLEMDRNRFPKLYDADVSIFIKNEEVLSNTISELNDTVKQLNEKIRTIRENKNQIGKRLDEAAHILHNLSLADYDENTEKYRLIVDEAREFLNKYGFFRDKKKDEAWMDSILRQSRDSARRDIDDMEKMFNKATKKVDDKCDCPACQITKMIKDGIKSGIYSSKSGKIVFGC